MLMNMYGRNTYEMWELNIVEVGYNDIKVMEHSVSL